MSQLDRTAENLEDTLMSLNNNWRSAQDFWLDANRSEFENLFWMEIEKAMRKALDDYQRFAEVVEHAQQSLES